MANNPFEIPQPMRDLTEQNIKQVALGKDGGTNELIDTFDPTVEQTLFIPQLIGG